jgi:hypothetical protein
MIVLLLLWMSRTGAADVDVGGLQLGTLAVGDLAKHPDLPAQPSMGETA